MTPVYLTKLDPRRERLLSLLGFALVLAAVVGVGLPYALARHFHVDEVQLIANTSAIARGARTEYLNYITPYSAAMSWFVRGLSSVAVYVVMRASLFALFVAILLLLAISQPHFTTPARRAFVLALAAVDYPLWSHGFELRHDVVGVAGLVALLAIAHRASRSRLLFVAGLVAGTMALHSAKSLVFSLPALMVILFVARPSLRAIGAVALGVVTAIATMALVLAAAGVFRRYLALNLGFVSFVAAAQRFSPVPLLRHLAMVAPLTIGLALFALVTTGRDVARRTLTLRSTPVITHAFLLIAIAGVLINPTPFTYNVLYVAPFLVASSIEALSRLPRAASAIALLASAALFARNMMVQPQAIATNEAQLSIVRAAEALTSPSDPVLDGAGLVVTRDPPAADWILHSVLRAAYAAGQRESFAAIMRRDAPPVVIVNYRWMWLRPEDWETLHGMYVAIAPHVHVLGGISREGNLRIDRAGRYVLECNGARRIVELPRGDHPRGCEGPTAYYWIGPNLIELPRVQKPHPLVFISD